MSIAGWIWLGAAMLVPATAKAADCATHAPAVAPAGEWPRTGAAIEARDRTDIEDLMARYAIYADAGEGAAFASTFTPDGELAFGGLTIRGQAALAARMSAKTRRTLHLAGAPVLVQIAPDRVKARSRLLFIAEDAASGGQSVQTIGFSTYADEIVRTCAGWKFARREAGDPVPLDPAFLPYAR